MDETCTGRYIPHIAHVQTSKFKTKVIVLCIFHVYTSTYCVSIHICIYTYASFPFYCCHTYVHVVMHSYISRRLFTALFKLGLRFIFALKRNCCVFESVYRSCDHKDDVDNDDCD